MEMEERGLGKGVANFSRAQHGLNFGGGKKRGFHIFVIIQIEWPDMAAVFNEHKMGAVIENGWIWRAGADEAGVCSDVAGFLRKLTLRGGDRVLARLGHAPGRFPRKGAVPHAELADEEQAPILCQCERLHPIAGLNDKKITFAFVAKALLTPVDDLEYWTGNKDLLGEGYPL